MKSNAAYIFYSYQQILPTVLLLVGIAIGVFIGRRMK